MGGAGVEFDGRGGMSRIFNMAGPCNPEQHDTLPATMSEVRKSRIGRCAIICSP